MPDALNLLPHHDRIRASLSGLEDLLSGGDRARHRDDQIGPRLDHLGRVHDEVISEQGKCAAPPSGPQVQQRSVEIPGLGEDGDGGRTSFEGRGALPGIGLRYLAGRRRGPA